MQDLFLCAPSLELNVLDPGQLMCVQRMQDKSDDVDDLFIKSILRELLRGI